MLTPAHDQRLVRLAQRLIDQDAARVLVPPQQNADGFWFGGGNLAVDDDGALLLCGRYRNYGDSRTGVGAGERGLEFAIFRAAAGSPLGPWEKVKAFSKAELGEATGSRVVSIEGGGLLRRGSRWELYVSTEKAQPYPEEFAEFQKPGTGVWSIDVLAADSVGALEAASAEPVIPPGAPHALHVKDPVPFLLPDGRAALIFCTHPFCWSSSGSALALEGEGGNLAPAEESILARGPAWDIAATRVTERLAVPKLGVFADAPDCALYFYDGAECLRPLDENPKAVRRPRGYSCEEIGGVAACADGEFPKLRRLSVNFPLFVSPRGTGCSRYVSAIALEGGIFAAWQQGQADGSQPLVGTFTPMDEVARILS